MVVHRVQKVVAVSLLDATKATLEQLSRHRLHLGERPSEASRDLVALYGSIRRLRDYLQRCIGAFRDEVELDFPAEDLPPLVACIRRGAEQADELLAEARTGNDREWLQRKRDLLAEWAVKFAARPLLDLPLPRSKRLSPAMRQLDVRLRRKVTSEATPKAPPPKDGIDAAAPARIDGERLEKLMEEPAPATARPPVAAAGDAASLGVAVAAASVAQAEPAEAPLLDPQRVRDPRLRALVTLDLRAFERAAGAHDHRIAAVHLASVLEGAVIDHALGRTAELGLMAGPESWNPQEILLRMLGPECSANDRAAVYHLFSAYHLIRPLLQLHAPIAVTASAFDRQVGFVRRLLRQMGYTG